MRTEQYTPGTISRPNDPRPADNSQIRDLIVNMTPAPAPAPVTLGDLADYDTGRDCRIDLFIPSTIDINQPVSQSEFSSRTEQISRGLCRLFGGSTVTPAGGYYLDTGTGKLIYERINIVSCYMTPGDLAAHSGDLADLAVWCRDNWRQSSIMLVINGSMLTV